MTPTFAAAYEALSTLVAREATAELTGALRAENERRVGAFDVNDPWFEERSAALWDRVLTDGAVLARATTFVATRGEAPLSALLRGAVDALARAQRGLFEVHAAERGSAAGAPTLDLECAVTGAAFRLAPSDEIARALALADGGAGEGATALLDAHVVPTPEGVTLLPGVLAHSPEATRLVHDIVRTDAARALPLGDLLDGILGMRHRFMSLTRVRARQVYRVEALGRD